MQNENNEPQNNTDILYDFIYCNLATPDQHEIAVQSFKNLTDVQKVEMYEYANRCDTDFSNGSNFENGIPPTLEESKENILFLVNEWKQP